MYDSSTYWLIHKYIFMDTLYKTLKKYNERTQSFQTLIQMTEYKIDQLYLLFLQSEYLDANWESGTEASLQCLH